MVTWNALSIRHVFVADVRLTPMTVRVCASAEESTAAAAAAPNTSASSATLSYNVGLFTTNRVLDPQLGHVCS